MVNVKPKQLGKNVRMSFGKINEALEIPNLIEVQKNSYQWFKNEGLKEVFRDVSAITDYNGNLVLNFVDYKIDDTPKYTIAECKERDVTYAAPLRVTATLWNKETGDVKESEIFMGDFPLNVLLFHSLFVPPVFITLLKKIKQVRIYLKLPLFLTGAHGSNTKWIQVTLFT